MALLTRFRATFSLRTPTARRNGLLERANTYLYLGSTATGFQDSSGLCICSMQLLRNSSAAGEEISLFVSDLPVLPFSLLREKLDTAMMADL